MLNRTVLSWTVKRNDQSGYLLRWGTSSRDEPSKVGMSGALWRRSGLAMLLATFVSVACASRAATPPPGSPVTNGLLLRVDTRGGSLAPAATLSRIPQFSLYADGLLVMEGAQIEIYPGPATPPVFSMNVDTEGVRRIAGAARMAGLDGPNRSYENPTGGDVGTTTFTFIDRGRTHTTSVAGLGIEPSDPSVPQSERKARAALQELDGRLGNLRGWLPAGSVSRDQPFEYQRLAVIVSDQPSGEGPDQPALTWPLDRPVADLAEPVAGAPAISCLVVSGQDLAKLRPLVARANDLTPWKSDGHTYWLRFRPLLPDESRCPHL